MNSLYYGLRFRLAFTFALFGILISLVLSAGLFAATHSLGMRLVDETLSSEIEDFYWRRQYNPKILLPATITVRGYVHQENQPQEGMPAELVRLSPGKYQMTIHRIPYRIDVVDKGRERYIMMFNVAAQQHREETFLTFTSIVTLIMIFLSAWIGWWLAGRIVRPISELARRVGIATPSESGLSVAQGFSDDEIGTLAKVFDSYLNRMRAFIERERAFTADVSHELRTPLAIVQGVVELMEADGMVDLKQQRRIERIGRANREMTDITAALLLMAREEGWDDEPVMQQCDVWDVAIHATDAHRHLLSPDTTIRTECIARVHVDAERTLLSIVVSNLIRNAFAYTPSGTVSILLDESGLSISDTGSGINEDEIGRVFDRYAKGAQSKGKGIGLSLVKRICDRYDWKIEIRSVVGQGTTAKLIF